MQYRRWIEKIQDQNKDELNIKKNNLRKFTRMSIRETIEKNPKLIILGDPGLGKTTI